MELKDILDAAFNLDAMPDDNALERLILLAGMVLDVVESGQDAEFEEAMLRILSEPR